MSALPAVAALALAAAVACQEPIASEPLARSAVVWEAERLARSCAGDLPVARSWATLQYRIADQLPGEREGLTRGPIIYILRKHRDHALVIAHELLHAVYGLPGDGSRGHDPLFAACGLGQGQI